MPKLLRANAARDSSEERRVRRLAQSRHAPGDWIRRPTMIVRSWEGLRTTAIARELGCHPQTVRERIVRFNAEGMEGLGDRPGPGRKPRLSEAERSQVIALAKGPPPGAIARQPEGTPVTAEAAAAAHWPPDALVDAAHGRGIRIGRRQVRRILLREKVRRRSTRGWADSSDPDLAPKGPRSSRSPRPRPSTGRSSPAPRAGRCSRGPSRRRRAGRRMGIGSGRPRDTAGGGRRSGSTGRCGCATGTS
jgi:transposase